MAVRCALLAPPVFALYRLSGRVFQRPVRILVILAYKLKPTKGVTQMNILKTFIVVVTSMIFIAGLSACEKKNSAEAVGEKIDEAAEEAGDTLNEKIID